MYCPSETGTSTARPETARGRAPPPAVRGRGVVALDQQRRPAVEDRAGAVRVGGRDELEVAERVGGQELLVVEHDVERHARRGRRVVVLDRARARAALRAQRDRRGLRPRPYIEGGAVRRGRGV